MKVIDAWVGNRPSPEVEIEGLDIPEFGAPGYSWEAGTLAAQPPAVTGAQPPSPQNQHTTTVSRRIER
jgi:hypothetical protein